MIDYTKIFEKYYPEYEVNFEGDSYEGIVVLLGGQKPSQSELEAKWVDYVNDRNANAYKEQRRLAYIEAGVTPENYLDAERKARNGDTTERDALDALAAQIKADIPKP